MTILQYTNVILISYCVDLSNVCFLNLQSLDYEIINGTISNIYCITVNHLSFVISKIIGYLILIYLQSTDRIDRNYQTLISNFFDKLRRLKFIQNFHQVLLRIFYYFSLSVYEHNKPTYT